MSASTIVSVEDYLAMAPRPDVEYVEGEIVERHVGEHDHSRLQILIGAFLTAREDEMGFSTFTEQRVRVSSAPGRVRFRIPDVCVLPRPYEHERVLTHPPLVVIGILSPEDTLAGMMQRINDYVKFGVRYIWVVDPNERAVYVARDSGLHRVNEDPSFQAPNGQVTIPVAALFDRIRP